MARKPRSAQAQIARSLTEKAFQSNVVDAARKLGWMVHHSRTARILRKDGTAFYATPLQGDPGFPDLVLVKGKRILWRELKTEQGTLTDEQHEWQVRLLWAGADYAIWRPSMMDEIVVELHRR